MFTFKVIETFDKSNEKILTEAFKFRYKIIHDELNVLPANKAKIDSDEYDKYSIHFIAFDKDNNICATTRLILNSPLELPTPKNMKIDLKLYNKNVNFAELSRVFIDKKIRNLTNSKEIMYRFISLIDIYLKRDKIHFIYAALEKKFIRLLHIIHIEFQIIGEGAEFYGFRYPCITTRQGLGGKNPYIK